MAEKLMKGVMHHGVITCFPDKSLREVARMMIQNDIREVVVVDHDTLEVRGVISDRLLVQAYGTDLDEAVAEDILLPFTATTSPESTLTKAIELMQQNRIRNVVVVEDEGYGVPRWPAGIVSYSDTIMDMAELELLLPHCQRW